MSANKSRYYDVFITKTVRAKNMTDATSAAFGKKVAGTEVLLTSTTAERISASEAHDAVASAS